MDVSPPLRLSVNPSLSAEERALSGTDPRALAASISKFVRLRPASAPAAAGNCTLARP
jgi:hypothetical protein